MTPDLPPLPADIAAIRDALKFTNRIGKPQPSLYYAECTPERIARLLDALEQAQKDAARYRWLRDLRCNSVSVSRDDDHACNYMTASDWIDNNPEWYADDDPVEIQRMRDTNTIWRLQVYPNTPVGFNAWNASTLDAAIDAAMKGDT